MIPPNDDQKVSSKWIKSVLSQEMTPDIKYAVQQLADLWLHMAAKIKEIDKRLMEQSLHDEHLERIYQSVPGVGPLAARILANELGDMSQFPNERKLFSFTGLTPSEYSSGTHVRQGHISRQGRPVLRRVLVQSAWVAIRYDYDLLQVYERISQKSGKKKAIVAIARRLVGRIRSCLKRGEVYQVRSVPDYTATN